MLFSLIKGNLENKHKTLTDGLSLPPPLEEVEHNCWLTDTSKPSSVE